MQWRCTMIHAAMNYNCLINPRRMPVSFYVRLRQLLVVPTVYIRQMLDLKRVDFAKNARDYVGLDTTKFIMDGKS